MCLGAPTASWRAYCAGDTFETSGREESYTPRTTGDDVDSADSLQHDTDDESNETGMAVDSRDNDGDHDSGHDGNHAGDTDSDRGSDSGSDKTLDNDVNSGCQNLESMQSDKAEMMDKDAYPPLPT